MANKRYYWLKLQRDFFKRHDIRIIESMPNGKDYILFYLKLLVESIDHEGELRFSETIPYNEEMLATITNTNIDIVRSAMKVFCELNMIEVLEDNTIFMQEVEKMIGSAEQDEHTRESTRNRVRAYRERQKKIIDSSKKRYCNVTCNGEKDIEIDIDKDTDTNKSICVNDEGQKKFDLDNAFKLFFDKYPKKNRPAVAKTEFLNMMIDVIPSQHEELCKSLWKGMMLYLETKEKEGKLDYLPNFDKWLIEDSTYWMEQAERIENEQTS